MLRTLYWRIHFLMNYFVKKGLIYMLLIFPIFIIISSCGSPLIKAINRGDVTFINRFQGDINEVDKDGKTVLISLVCYEPSADANTSIQLRKVDIERKDVLVKALIEAGANVNAIDKNGRTALMYAAEDYRRNVVLVKTLIESGANVNAIDKNGRTALMYADYKDIIVKVLIEAGANVNAIDKNGRTALDILFDCLKGNTVSVKIMDFGFNSVNKLKPGDLVKILGYADMIFVKAGSPDMPFAKGSPSEFVTIGNFEICKPSFDLLKKVGAKFGSELIN